MQAKNRVFKSFVIVLVALIALGGALLVLKNLNVGEAGNALNGTEAAGHTDENMEVATTSKSVEVPEGEGADDGDAGDSTGASGGSTN